MREKLRYTPHARTFKFRTRVRPDVFRLDVWNYHKTRWQLISLPELADLDALVHVTWAQPPWTLCRITGDHLHNSIPKGLSPRPEMLRSRDHGLMVGTVRGATASRENHHNRGYTLAHDGAGDGLMRRNAGSEAVIFINRGWPKRCDFPSPPLSCAPLPQ